MVLPLLKGKRLKEFKLKYPKLDCDSLSPKFGLTREQMYNLAFRSGLKKNEEFCGKFRKGTPPWNKGKRGGHSWNRGLTKESDIRVRKNAESTKKTINEMFKCGKIKVWSKGLRKGNDLRVLKCSLRMIKNNPVKSMEVRNKISKSILKLYKNKPEILENRKPSGINQFTGVFSSLELKIKNKLNKLGIKFHHNFKIGRYWADFLILNKVVIECDGEYWHPIGNVHDKIKDKYLIKRGYKVIRIRENKIQNVDMILKLSHNYCIKEIQ